MTLKHAPLCAVLLLAGLATFSSCKKKEETNPDVPAAQSLQTEDNNDVKTEADQVNSDINDALENFPSLRGGRVGADSGTGAKQICGCSITSDLANKKITLNFDGTTPCGSPSRSRGGKIEVQLVRGARWSDLNAMLKVTMTNYKVTRLETQKSVTFNGVKTLTNMRGWNWLGYLAGTDSIVYKERGKDIQAVFNNGGTHVFSLYRSTSNRLRDRAGLKRVYIRATGDTTYQGLQNVDTYGTNRNGQAFTGQLLTPWSSNSYCGFWRPTQGEMVYKAAGNSLTLTAGVNESGNVDTRDCAYGYKVAWQLSTGTSGSVVKSY